MKTHWIDQEFLYNGEQLRSLFAYKEYKVLGNAIVSWQGPCNIPFEHMVDGEDILAGAEIKGDKMIHFIVEKFSATLPEMVALQRLLTSMSIDLIRKMAAKSDIAQGLLREGDDIFYGLEKDTRKKLSISIATVSPVSGMIHFALNIVNSGTPVNTLSFAELDVEAGLFAKNLMSAFSQEILEIDEATKKVHWVS